MAGGEDKRNHRCDAQEQRRGHKIFIHSFREFDSLRPIGRRIVKMRTGTAAARDVEDRRTFSYIILDSQAITATAHKLARIVFHLLNTKESYNETVFHRFDQEALRRAELRLRKYAAQLGFQLIPAVNS